MRNREEVRNLILESAKTCFEKNGFKESTMRDIAQEAGVSPGTIYTYFKSKQELFDELHMPEYANFQPNNEKKKQEILSAALILFAEKGYNGVTMEDIAAKLHVSKATIYLHFSGKEDLFSQILQSSSFNMFVTTLHPNDQTDFRQAIMEIGRNYLSIGDSPERSAILKTVIRESSTFPELGTLYYEKGLNPAYNHIIAYVNDYCIQHNIPIRDILKLRSLITTYIGSLQSYLLMHNIMKGIPHDIDKETYLETTTDVFISYLVQDGYLS